MNPLPIADAANATIDNSVPKDVLDDYLPLSALREEGKLELLVILESLRGRKCLLVDSQLAGLLNQVLVEGSKFLKENGVQHYKELKGLKGDLSDILSDSTSGRDVPENIVYLIRPNLTVIKIIATQIKSAVRSGIKSQFHVCFVPKLSTVCVHLLEEEIDSAQIWDKVVLHEFQLGLIPYDTDLLSLELEDVFRQCYVDGDLSSLHTIAMALLKIQSLYGVIPNIKGKGLGAKKVLQKLCHLRVEEEAQLSGTTVASSTTLAGSGGGQQAVDKELQRSQIDTLVVIDREVDLVSPFLTPLTYEGLIDEFIGIENGRIRVDASLVGDDKEVALPSLPANLTAQQPEGAAAAVAAAAMASVTAASQPSGKRPAAWEKVAVLLNNTDAVYSEIRDLSVERLGSYLQEQAIHIRQRYSNFRDKKDASIAEIHDFLKKIPKLTGDFKSLNQHINIAEVIKSRTDSREFRDQWQGERGMLEGESFLDAIEEMLYSDTERSMFFQILRLLCVQSATAGGIRSSRYDQIRRTIAHIYGYDQIFTLSNLEKAGLIRRKDVVLVDTASIWQTLRKQLRLIDDRVDMSRPDDISYVSAGYAPLLVRLVQLLGGGGAGISGTGAGASPWSQMIEVLKLLPGPLCEFNQSYKPEEFSEAVNRYTAEMSAAHAMTAASGGAQSAFGAATTLSTASIINYTTGIMSSAADLQGINAKLKGSGKTGSLSGATATATTMTAASSSTPPGVLFDGDEEYGRGKKIMLVFVVGGLSFIEIAAFRFLSKDPNYPYRIVLATTKFVNGNTFLRAMHNRP